MVCLLCVCVQVVDVSADPDRESAYLPAGVSGSRQEITLPAYNVKCDPRHI